MASVRDIAQRTNVSISTVSRVLNHHPEVSPETREKVLKIARKSGYSRGVNRRVATNLGLAFTGEMYWSNYDALLMHGMLRAANEHKLDVLVINIAQHKLASETYTQFFSRKGVRGVVLRTSAHSRHICEEIASEDFPAIVVADRFEDPRVSFVSYHSGRDSRRAVEHLIHLGHRRIGLAISQDPDRDHEDRRQGYEQALSMHGITVDPELIVAIRPDLRGGANAFNRLMTLPHPPSAIFFTDPPATIGAALRVQEVGLKVPDDISLVGFDDAEERFRVFPTLTAICQNTKHLGFEATNLLLRSVDGKSVTPIHKVSSTLFEINQSTGIVTNTPMRILPDGVRVPAEAQGESIVPAETAKAAAPPNPAVGIA